ncbi:flagellar assembly protein FliH [Thauera sinica]|uniref:Flagellar assembly protein FliH n=1 Tax=Thauera sinica TaxID=2665146 RepID=A0ABW1APD4_9RHOO|nr:flagellar assembly protein FliH [Thauera sp. K11]ATE59424.1 flagellar assembly protein FliH [Thauera sp. K11]
MSITRHQAAGAYRRWEPVDFDAPETPPAPDPPPPAEEPAPAPLQPEPEPEPLAGLQLPTAEDIERMHEDARAAGHAEGHAEGYAAGFEAGREAGQAEGAERVEEAARRLAELAGNLDQALGRLDQEVAEELMALSIEIARQMVHHTLAVHPEAVIDTVRSALLQIPQGHAQIRLHPDDCELVRQHMGEQLGHSGHRIIEDAELLRGSCRIDSPGAQVDATLETRWQRTLETLGREHAQWQPSDDDGEA